MTEGWIKFYRSMLDHPRYTDGDWLKLWVFLLCQATHAELKKVFNGVVITLKPGQLITSRKSISAKTGIQESKVERLLCTLKAEHQIEQQSSSTSRLITVRNWDKYQKLEQQNDQPVNSDRTANEQRMNSG